MFQYDLIIRNAKVITGTGAPWFMADVAIANGLISSIGHFGPNLSKEEIFADGNYLTPGFIDSHTHDDIEMLKNPNLAKLLQGITTVVTGNCNFSNYPISYHTDNNINIKENNEKSSELIKSHLSLILGDIKSDKIFKDFNNYKRKLETSGIAMNVISLTGHGPIRLAIMGYEKRYASDKEITAMCELLDVQMKQGSAGLSFGFMYAPSSYADQNELISLASVVKKYNGIVAAHIRCYGRDLLDSINEFITILKCSGAKGLLSHLQIAGKPYWGMMNKALQLIEDARCNGVDICLDMYPYKAGSSSILQLLPPAFLEGGFGELLKKLDDPIIKNEIQVMVERGNDANYESKISLIGWENVTIASVTNPKLKFSEGMTIVDAAKVKLMSPFEFLIQTIKDDNGTSCIIMFQQCDDDQILVHQSRLHMIGSDGIPREGGKPHPRHYGTFPRVIGQLAIKDNIIPLEEAIRKCTSLPAQRFNLQDRGILMKGLSADLVLFNGNEFCDRASYDEPHHHPNGLIGVWVNGIRVVNNGKFCSTFPGRVLSTEKL